MREDEYRLRAEALDHEGLLGLWEQIERDDTPGWEPGKAFEYLVLRAFQIEGAEVQWPYSVELLDLATVEQMDGAIYAAGLACLVEAKDQADRTHVEPLAKLRSQLMRRPAGVVGLLLARAGFTPAAALLAHFMAPQLILLWKGDEVAHCLEQHSFVDGLQRKYRVAVETGVPYWSLTGR